MPPKTNKQLLDQLAAAQKAAGDKVVADAAAAAQSTAAAKVAAVKIAELDKRLANALAAARSADKKLEAAEKLAANKKNGLHSDDSDDDESQSSAESISSLARGLLPNVSRSTVKIGRKQDDCEEDPDLAQLNRIRKMPWCWRKVARPI
jgi:hypothetical protein